MKKMLCAVLAVVMMLCTVCAFAEGDAVRVATLKGPTGMAIAHMMSENDGTYEFILAGAPDEITGQLVGGNIDIACVPTNLAAVLYNKTKGGVKALAAITGGMLYVLERGDSVNSVKDLEGKNVLSAGQGAAPEYVFGFVLNQNNVNANVTYAAEQTEVISLAVAGKADIVLLPEPHVTTLLTKDASFRVAFGLTEAFGEAAAQAGYTDAGLHMSTVIVRTAFLEEHPEQVAQFMADCQASILFVLENTDAAAEEIAAQGIIPAAAVAKKALPNCALTFIAGEELVARLTPMLQVLFEANPAAVGGSMPDTNFYFIP